MHPTTIPEYIDHLRRAGFVAERSFTLAHLATITVATDEGRFLATIMLWQRGGPLRRFIELSDDVTTDVAALHRLEAALDHPVAEEAAS
jgi:hypothetical protein